jgi:hypothetical protein
LNQHLLKFKTTILNINISGASWGSTVVECITNNPLPKVCILSLALGERMWKKVVAFKKKNTKIFSLGENGEKL